MGGFYAPQIIIIDRREYSDEVMEFWIDLKKRLGQFVEFVEVETDGEYQELFNRFKASGISLVMTFTFRASHWRLAQKAGFAETVWINDPSGCMYEKMVSFLEQEIEKSNLVTAA